MFIHEMEAATVIASLSQVAVHSSYLAHASRQWLGKQSMPWSPVGLRCDFHALHLRAGSSLSVARLSSEPFLLLFLPLCARFGRSGRLTSRSSRSGCDLRRV